MINPWMILLWLWSADNRMRLIYRFSSMDTAWALGSVALWLGAQA
jgi:hypothetical protein